MKLYLAVPVVLLALLIAASGVAAVSRGWVLPTNRRPVRHPRLYGWGQLMVAFALCRQMVFLLLLSDPDTRQWGTLTGSALLLTGSHADRVIIECHPSAHARGSPIVAVASDSSEQRGRRSDTVCRVHWRSAWSISAGVTLSTAEFAR